MENEDLKAMAEVFTRPTGPVGGARTASAIDQGLRIFMLGTYNYMALGLAGTAAVVMLLMANPSVMAAIALGPMKWVVFAGVLGLGWFAPRLFFSGSEAVAHGAYWLYCALWGALMAPMISLFVSHGIALFQYDGSVIAMFIGKHGAATQALWPRSIGGTNQNRRSP